MIEYVALGDYSTAVGFLLASTPEKSARYYRDALCTLALAVSLGRCSAALYNLQKNIIHKLKRPRNEFSS